MARDGFVLSFDRSLGSLRRYGGSYAPRMLTTWRARAQDPRQGASTPGGVTAPATTGAEEGSSSAPRGGPSTRSERAFAGAALPPVPHNHEAGRSRRVAHPAAVRAAAVTMKAPTERSARLTATLSFSDELFSFRVATTKLSTPYTPTHWGTATKSPNMLES